MSAKNKLKKRNENIIKKKNSKKSNKNVIVESVINDSKFTTFYYSVLPLILAILATAISFIRIIIRKFEANGEIRYDNNVSITSLFDGNPNIVAILGCLCMILCVIVVPKSIKKVRKSGDGLGVMFMPLGLLGIFTVMCTIENIKDLAVGIGFGVLLFIISALGTFKKTIHLIMPLCIAMIFAALALLLMGYMPYCFNSLPYVVKLTDHVTNQEEFTLTVAKYYYLTYFIRDVLLLLSFGIFSDGIKRTYRKMEVEQ